MRVIHQQPAVLAITQHIRHSGPFDSHNRRVGGHGFSQHHALRLAERRKGKDIHRPISRNQFVPLQDACKPNSVVQILCIKSLLQLGSQRPGADNDEVLAGILLQKLANSVN